MLQGLLIRYSLGSIDGKMIGSNKEIKLGSTYGKVIGTILGNVDGITLGLQVKIELVSLDGSSDGSNSGKVLEYDGWINSGSNNCKLIRTIFGNLDGITLGIEVKIELDSSDISFVSFN